jgi:outer membrane immunogenic protein
VKRSILCVTALLALGTASATAEEMATPPSQFITTTEPYLTWLGFYAGINGGYGWGNSSVSYSPNDPAAHTNAIPSTDFYRDGAIAGGQIGFNWQFNSHWLAGVEADFQWSDFDGTGQSSSHLTNIGSAATLSTISANQTVSSFGTVRARMGAIIMNSLLLYGTGGLAFGQVRENLSMPAAATGALTSGSFSYSCVAGTTCFAGSSSKTLWGWSAGAGAEYAITSNLTFKTELLYVYLEAPSATAVATGVATPASFTATFAPVYFAVVRGGVNLRF